MNKKVSYWSWWWNIHDWDFCAWVIALLILDLVWLGIVLLGYRVMLHIVLGLVIFLVVFFLLLSLVSYAKMSYKEYQKYLKHQDNRISLKPKVNCGNCEFVYMNPRQGCHWKDFGAISIPKTLSESSFCPYWELKGSVYVDFESLTKEKDLNLGLLAIQNRNNVSPE